MGTLELGLSRIEVFLLVLTRTAGIFTLMPTFGSAQIPVQARVITALALTLVFAPLALASADTGGLAISEASQMLLLVAREALVGLAIGFITMLVFAAIQCAGDFIDLHAGFSFAAIVDPMYGTETAIAGRFHQLLAGALFFVTNAHHILLVGLAQSFQILPVGTIGLGIGSPDALLKMFAGLFAVAVKIAAPVVAAVFLADVALAVLA
ncbi:MAG: flagellar biosynthetic protein FliR, partial [Armatimonadota bacterium]